MMSPNSSGEVKKERHDSADNNSLVNLVTSGTFDNTMKQLASSKNKRNANADVEGSPRFLPVKRTIFKG